MYSSGGFYPQEIEQSLRFNDNDSAYLSWTPTSTTNRKTWTWSGWVKRGNLVGCQLFSSGLVSGTYNYHVLGFSGNDRLNFNYYPDTGTTAGWLSTARLFRDPSAWYHIHAVWDTTQATSSDRMRLYVNGVQETDFVTETFSERYPSQNTDGFVNNSSYQHRIGQHVAGSSNALFDGYLAEVNFIDGQALDPTDFGEFKSGVWVAKSYSGSYGTNGFYLDFSNSGSLGADSSGNGNNWTANNLAAIDQVLDSPTNNFCTLNPVDKRSGSNVNEANLYIGPVSNNHYWARGTIKIPNENKIYLEALAGDNGSGSIVAFFGISSEGANVDSGQMENGVACNSADFYKQVDNVGSTQGAGVLAAGDIVGLAFDMPNSTMTIYKNGSVTTNAVSFTPGQFYLYLSIYFNYGGTPSWVLNAGQDSSFGGRKTPQGNTDDNGYGDFYYAPPSGYLALCTANLPSPAIDPAKDDVPSDYFNTSLWTGNDTQRSITVGWQPDLVWTKYRSSTGAHTLMDSVRGASARLFSNLTDAEATTNGLISFDSDGFTMGDNATSHNMNASGVSVVGWSWLAGNGTSSNTDGSITSTVSVNQKAGFSIVSYTGNATAGATVGHGLNVAPSVLIVKNRDSVYNWPVYHGANGTSAGQNVLFLNATTANTVSSGPWNNTAPSSSVFTLGSGAVSNNSGDDYIAYCFAEVEGYSKFGSYTGNGSNDGPFIYCGFRPSLFLTKRTDSTSDWQLLDTSRDTYNAADAYLKPNTSGAEATGGPHDFVSNGFKIRNTGGSQNASGGTYIFMAFAENPFKYANAR